MQRLKSFIFIIAAFLISLSNVSINAQELVTEERDVNTFNRISIAVSGDVFITQGTGHGLVLEGSQRVLDDLITEVRGGQLTVRMPWRWNFRRNDELTVYITVADLSELNLSGSAKVFVEDLLEAENISFNISGSGRVRIDELSANNLTTKVSGSGRLELGGSQKLESHEITVSGSGRVESSSLPASKVSVNISGSGRCYVNVISGLDVRISGSGRVVYDGNPVVNSKISGSGRVTSAN